MKRLTTKEKEIMDLYWKHGPMFVKELLGFYDEPRPHFNTLSTTVRILEKKGFLDHKQFGTSYQYFPTISEQEYGRSSLTGIIKNYSGTGINRSVNVNPHKDSLVFNIKIINSIKFLNHFLTL